MFEKVLCAIDGSRGSVRAVHFTVGMAAKLGAEVRFVTVSTASPAAATRTAFWNARLFEAGEMLIAREQEHAMKEARSHGLEKASCVTISGHDVATAILGYANEHSFDHIVMGTIGHSALERFLTGSVVDAVLNQPHPPVTVV